MDPKLAYWVCAWLNMAVAVSSALRGVQLARRGEIVAHRRHMLFFATLVALFLLSYPVKLLLLGSEELELWGVFHVSVLRFHELCVLVMLLAGLRAGGLAWRLGLLRGVSPKTVNPKRLAAHRRAGRVAVAAAVIGLLSASFVLAGMIQRAGWGGNPRAGQILSPRAATLRSALGRCATMWKSASAQSPTSLRAAAPWTRCPIRPI
ncbi:MAG: DUF420 domain-containing protein [Myxococcota bacterium]